MGIWDRIAKQDNLQIILDFLLKSKDFNNTEKKYIENFFNRFKVENPNQILKFSHFDLMAKNIAFNVNSQEINGIYDFGDCSIGDVYHDFSQIGLDYNKKTLGLISFYYTKLSNINLDINQICNYSFFSWLTHYYNNKTKYQIVYGLKEIKRIINNCGGKDFLDRESSPYV